MVRSGITSSTVYGMVLVALLVTINTGFAVNSSAEGTGRLIEENKEVYVCEVEHGVSPPVSGEVNIISSDGSIFIDVETQNSLISDKEIASSEKKKDNSTQSPVFDIELTEKKNTEIGLLFLSLLFLMSVIILLLALHIWMHKKGENRTSEKRADSEKKELTKPPEKKIVSGRKESSHGLEREFTSLPLALTVLDSIYQSQMPEEAMPMASMGPLMDFYEEEQGMDLEREVEVGMDFEKEVPL